MNVVATVQLQQTNFVHKASKRDELLGGNTIHAKARITIPRDPDLETAHRAQGTRLEFHLKTSERASQHSSPSSKSAALRSLGFELVNQSLVRLALTRRRHECQVDELLGGNTIHAKARIIVPRDPDLETAHRAQRTRLEFHLKTSEKASQHSSPSSKSAVPLNRSNKDSHVLTTNLTTDCGSREPGRKTSSQMN
ncbi:hypothetical protein OROHE_006028 [Orobanche hederae]